MSRTWAFALVAALVAFAAAPVHGQPAGDDDKPKASSKKRTKSDKRKRKKPRTKPMQSEPKQSEPTDAATDKPAAAEPASEPDGEGPVVTDDDEEPEQDTPAVARDAATTAAPAAPTRRKAAKLTSSGATSVATSATPWPRARRTWFVAGRVGPSLLERSGTYDFKSNRQLYSLQRNLRWEVVVGRYVSRRLALAFAVGSGPYVKHDGEDPLLGEVARFDVFPWHASLGLEVHASVFVVGLAAGAVRETMRGNFTTYDADTFTYAFHSVSFARFGVLGSAHTGVEAHWGHWGAELLAEASAVKLARGSYELDGMSNPAPSADEMGYVGSLLLGLRWQ